MNKNTKGELLAMLGLFACALAVIATYMLSDAPRVLSAATVGF